MEVTQRNHGTMAWQVVGIPNWRDWLAIPHQPWSPMNAPRSRTPGDSLELLGRRKAPSPGNPDPHNWRRQRWGSNYQGLQNISQSLGEESGKKTKLKMFETQDAKLQDLRNMLKVHFNRSQLGTPTILLCRHCKLTKPPNTSQAMFIHKGQQDYSLSWRNWYWTL